MTPDAKTADAPQPPGEGSPVDQGVGSPMAWFRASQERFFREVETTSRAWLARREEATLSAFDTFVRTTWNGGDPDRAMGAILDWQHGTFRRLACDMQHWVGFWSRCAAQPAAESQGGRSGRDGAARHAPATPAGAQAEPDPP